MMLPAIEKNKSTVVVDNDFSAGLWHRIPGKKQTFYDGVNTTATAYPAVAARAPRRRWLNLSEGVQGMFCADSLYLAADGELLRAGGENLTYYLGSLNSSRKVFGALGEALLILPDFKVLNIKTDQFSSKQVSLKLANVLIHNQDYVDTDGVARTYRRNTLHCVDYNFRDYFSVGDSIKLSGTASNDGYYTVRGVGEFDLHFDPESFIAEDIPSCTISRQAPLLEGMCSCGNRLWGYAGDTIYACAPGLADNWYRYDGDAQSSYCITVSDKGPFTGCVMHAGRPVFFKTGSMVEIYGDSPQNFTAVQTCLSGVARGSAASLCSVGGNMLYLSENGVISCSGSNAVVISEALGRQLYSGIATTDGRRYYLSAATQNGERALYIYDTVTKAWHIEDDSEGIAYLGYLDSDVYAYCNNHTVNILGENTTGHGKEYEQVSSYVDFAPLMDDQKGQLVPVRIGLRIRCAAGSALTLWVSYDGGVWEQRAKISAEGERIWYVPLQPRPCYSLGVRVEGTGEYHILSLIREYQ